MNDDGLYGGLRVTPQERGFGIVPQLLDILKARVILLGKKILEPGKSERASDVLRGQAYEVTMLINELERGAGGSPMQIQSPTGAD